MSVAADRVPLGKHWVAKTRRRILMMKEVAAVLEANERGRPYRGVFYALLALGGLILVTDPTRSLNEAGSVRWVWGSFMVLGNLFSLWGVIRDRWRVEWYGLPLQVSSLLGLVYVLIVVGQTTGTLAFACITASPIPVIVHRFVALYRLGKASKKMARKDRGEA